MSAPLRISATMLESFRLWMTEDWMKEEDLIAKIKGEFAWTPAMRLGTANHACVERPQRALSGYYEMDGFRFTAEAVESMLGKIEPSGLFEVKTTKEILIAQALYGKGANFDPGNDRVVSQAAGDLRKRLIEYYADEGQTDQCVIAIPTGSFVPEFRARSGPRPMATPAPSPGAGKIAEKSSMFVKAVGALAVLAVVLLGAVMFAQHAASKVRITSPQDGATVGPVGDVTGKGWEPKLNNYLIVEPVDQSGQRWVQAQIASAEWTRSAHFGQGDTPSGMRYRIYVLSTSTSLPIGELTKQADSPQESPAITVTLKK